jgi:hypothetical protein
MEVFSSVHPLLSSCAGSALVTIVHDTVKSFSLIVNDCKTVLCDREFFL